MLWFAVTAALAGLLALPAQVVAQQAGESMVAGTVTDAMTGQPIAAVAVRLAGTGSGTLTDAAGRFMLQAPGDGTLVFSRIGYVTAEVGVAGRARVDVRLEIAATRLDELVVTGYQTQRRGDITTAVASVNIEAAQQVSSSSILQRLAGTVPGVTVDASGAPGTRSTVRIRGISSFQNNNPLYIIDGTPVEESYANFLNPNDIESIQVLKDASAASIYGARASNGVVIITTRQGRIGRPQVSLSAHIGVATPTNGLNDILIQDPLEHFAVVRQSYRNAGLPIPTNVFGDSLNPTIPQFIYAEGAQRDQWGRPTNVDPNSYSYPRGLIMPGSQGTDWWGAVFGRGEVRDVNLTVNGGTATERYNVGINFFDQQGTARFNRYQRGTARVNSSFDIGRLTVGENISLALEESYGGMNDPGGYAENTILGKNILMQPVVPIRDIQGNYAAGKANTLGNHSNPLKQAEVGRDARNRSHRMFGNVYAQLALAQDLSARTNLGFNLGQNAFQNFNPPFPELAEPTFNNGMLENTNNFTDWTWNNTLNFRRTLAGQHNVTLLAGQEMNQVRNRFIQGQMGNLISNDPNSWYLQPALGNAGSMVVRSSGSVSSLLSFFGKADYNFGERYYLSGTLRRDGSSRLAEAHRWGTFPAFSAGWRVSQEPFMANQTMFTNIMLRAGWGVTGNQNIATGRSVDLFGGGTNNTFYDITGAGNSIAAGYRQTALGNPNLKWEENRSVNAGLDLEFLGGAANFALDVYQRDSDNLLFDPPLPGTAGMANPPIVNIGQVRNRGFDVGLGYRGAFANGINWNVDVNGAHYRNEIVRIDGNQMEFSGPGDLQTRHANNGMIVINRVGHAIGSFYGFRTDGYFQSAADIQALNAQARQATGDPNAVYQEGAAPGRIRFVDVDGDGRITAADRTITGSPHPDFTAGLNLGVTYRNWDFSTGLFGTFGNEIYEVQKEFYVFRWYNSNVRRDLMANSWTPENPNAKYPRLDESDTFSRAASDFYIEDGSYVRMRSLQVGYTVPQGRFAGFGDVRMYVRGENLFTITGYPGLDPSLPAGEMTARGMDVRDQIRGIDRGAYPSNRTISVGFNVNF
jgi:TonB-dependent starch-binding outer membrane protein SusC